MGQPIYQVDAFTHTVFAGNPAGVCVLARPAGEDWMLAVAREMNLSETAFVLDEGGVFGLRWFTPLKEVSLCGHATLASAHVLWESGRLPAQAAARFDTLSGRLTATRRGEWIELDFPAKYAAPAELPDGLADWLGVAPQYVGRNQLTYLVELADEAQVRALRPDFARLRRLALRCLIVTARATVSGGFDFVSRFFAPAIGIDEDPVTGSAHCYLTPYWAGRLGRDELLACQVSPRGGVLRVRAVGERVALQGQALTVFKGELLAS